MQRDQEDVPHINVMRTLAFGIVTTCFGVLMLLGSFFIADDLLSRVGTSLVIVGCLLVVLALLLDAKTS